MADSDLDLSGAPGFDLLALLAFLPSVISSIFTQKRGGPAILGCLAAFNKTKLKGCLAAFDKTKLKGPVYTGPDISLHGQKLARFHLAFTRDRRNWTNF